MCTSAPSAPQLSIDWTTQGTRFTLKPASSGATASTIFYNYVYYDSAGSTWEKWSSWNSVSGSSQSIYVAEPVAGKSKIAFSAYATNACGASSFARENSSNTGVVFSTLVKDEIKVDSTKLSFQVDVLSISLETVISSTQGMTLSFSSTPQSTCSVSSTQLRLFEPGICRITVTSGSRNNVSGADSKEVEFQVLKANNKITLITATRIKGFTNYILNPKILSSNGFEIKSISPLICSIKENTIIPLSTGKCDFTVTALEDKKYLEAKKAFSLVIEKSDNSIKWALPDLNFVDSVLQISPDLKFNVEFEANISTPEVCFLNDSVSIKLLKGGYCVVDLKTKDSPLVASASSQLKFKVSKLQNDIIGEYPASLLVGNPFKVTPKLKYLSDSSLSVKDGFYCSLSDGSLTGINEGTCTISIKVYDSEKYVGLSKIIDIKIEKKDQQIKLNQLSFFLENSKGPINLQAFSSSGLPLFLRSLTSSVCTTEGIQVIGLRTGECRLSLEQAGNNEHRAAETRFITGQVFMDKITITCVKGKLTKKVTAIKPVCPKGYKKKA
jgi:hypothetical protein